jgi:hypothetical protein
MDTGSSSRLWRDRPSGGLFGPTRMSVAAGWTLAVVVGALPVAATAQQIFMYPAQGQSKERQERDRYECNTWATEQTGFNPMQPPPSSAAYEPPPPPAEPQGGGLFQRGLLGGGLGGAALGAAGGAIGGNAGEGAAIGAAAGGLFGMFRRREQERQEMQQQTAYYQRAAAMRQQENAAAAAGRQAYTRAMKACLQGRGYSVE